MDAIPDETAVVKPPPIYLNEITNIGQMTASIGKLVGSSEFTIKALRNDEIKIQVKTIENYRKLVKECTSKGIKFHTYQVKSDRAFRVVIRNLHHSFDVELIKNCLEELNHKVRSVTNVRHRFTKSPMNMFFADIEPATNNKQIYDVREIGNAVVKIEPPKRTHDIPQCHRCQAFGHTKTYCTKDYRCVKCADFHSTKECPQPKEAKPTCCNCNKNHTASWKGCEAYINMIPKTKTNPVRPAGKNFNLKENEFPAMGKFTPIQQAENGLNFAQKLTQNNSRLEDLMMKQIEMMSTLMSMISVMINKLCPK